MALLEIFRQCQTIFFTHNCENFLHWIFFEKFKTMQNIKTLSTSLLFCAM